MVNFDSGVGHRNQFTVALFFLRKSIMMGSFMVQKTVSMTFFTDRWAQNFFFIVCFLCAPTPWTIFSIQVPSDKPVFSSFIKRF